MYPCSQKGDFYSIGGGDFQHKILNKDFRQIECADNDTTNTKKVEGISRILVLYDIRGIRYLDSGYSIPPIWRISPYSTITIRYI